MIGMTRRRVAIIILALVAWTAEAAAWRVMLRMRSNTIERNEAWAVMKREVIYHPSAYEDFVRTPIGKDGVNLWLGQGFEGLRWNAPAEFRIRRVEADVSLDAPSSYLHLLFRVGADGMYSFNLSRDERFPSGFYSFAPSWEARTFSPVALDPAVLRRSFRAAVVLDGSRYELFINGRPVAVFHDDRLQEGTIAVKGGFFPVHVRRVTVDYDSAGERRTWTETFDHGSPRGWAVAALLLAVIIAVAAGAALPAADRFRDWQWLLITASFMTAMFLAAVQVKTGMTWPGVAAPAVIATVMLIVANQMPERAPVPRRLSVPAFAAVAIAAVLLFARVGGGAAVVSRFGLDAPRALRIGEPLTLAPTALGDQRIETTIRVAPESIAELRVWAPTFRETPEFRCTERWHAVVLSTTPAVESGIYRFDGEPRLLAPLRLRESSPALRIETRGRRIVVRDGSAVLAEATVAERDAGVTSLHLFAGDAVLEKARVEGTRTARTDPDAPLPWRSALMPSLAGGFLLFLRGRRHTLRSVVIVLVLAAGSAGLVAIARAAVPVSGVEGRVSIWAIVSMQIAILGAFFGGRLSATWARAALAVVIAAVVGGSLLVALLGGFNGPFHVVQLEMQNDVPATPYSWLWYRHPSFRACNQFLHFQRFGGREVTFERPKGVRRLLAIGASQTFGFGASSYAASWPGVAEAELAGDGWQVINAGVPGSYTVTSRSYFDGVLRHYRPDAVVIDFCAADYLYLSLLALEGWDIDAALRRIERRGMHLDPVTRLAWNYRSWRGFRALRSGAQPEWGRIEQMYERSLERLVQSARRAGAEVFVVLEPKTTEVSHPILDYPRLYPAARRVALRNGATVIDPSHAMALAEQSGIAWWDYAHPTDFGYEVLGREIAAAVQDRVSAGGGS